MLKLTSTWAEVAEEAEREAWARFNGSQSRCAGAWSAIQYWRGQKRLAKAAALQRAPQAVLDDSLPPPASGNGGKRADLVPPPPIKPDPSGAAVKVPQGEFTRAAYSKPRREPVDLPF